MANPAPYGQEPEYPLIGQRLRDARVTRGMSLRALADRLGVSASLISQVERGRAKPSVNTLYALARELDVSLDELLFVDARPAPRTPAASSTSASPPAVSAAERHAGFSATPAAPPTASAEAPPTPMPSRFEDALRSPREPVQRATDRKTIRLASGVVWQRLTTESIPNVDFLYVVYEVGGASSPADEFQRHGGQEWGYVLSGTLGVTVGFDEYVLGPGDAIALDSTTPHRLYNLGDEPVHAIWYVLGRRPVDAGAAP